MFIPTFYLRAFFSPFNPIFSSFITYYLRFPISSSHLGLTQIVCSYRPFQFNRLILIQKNRFNEIHLLLQFHSSFVIIQKPNSTLLLFLFIEYGIDSLPCCCEVASKVLASNWSLHIVAILRIPLRSLLFSRLYKSTYKINT